MSSGRDPGPPPPRWLHCPRKSGELVAGKFLAFKTPLDGRFDPQVQPQFRFSPQMIFDSMKSYKVQLGLWVDLCNTSRFYSRELVQEKDARYVKLQCRGHGETPSAEQVATFNRLCQNYIQQNPLGIVAVHCTHGFNRTGFLIACCLIEIFDWSPEAAVAEFARARPPGIYKEHYIQEIFRRYGDVSDAPAAPQLPDWCFEEDAEPGEDDEGNSVGGGHDSNGHSGENGDRRGGRRREMTKKNPQFMAGVPGVTPVTDQSLLQQIQRKVQDMCGWRKTGFPGAQPVSMDRENIMKLRDGPYKVSWKADGTRYMMLLDGKDMIFFVDRDNCVFRVHNMTFLHRKMPHHHIRDTLLDGEMVIDEDHGRQIPRYLAYDVVKFENEDVGLGRFSLRLLCIEKEIISARHRYISEGKIDKTSEPFSIRLKQFWPLNDAATLLGPKFTKASLGHEPDGLVFQPSDKPYTAGRDDSILKWKPSSHNSVDFKLQVVRENRPGMLPETKGLLYVGGLNSPFAVMPKLKKELRELNNRIIECNWDAEKNEWAFMRERTDKSYPNGYKTAEGVVKSIQFPVTSEMLLDFIERYQFRQPVAPPPPAPRPSHSQPPHKMARTSQ